MVTKVDFEVADIRKFVGEGTLKAYADLRLGGCVVVKGFSVVNGKNGLFVSMPRKQSKDGKWYDILSMDDMTKQEISDRIMEAYDLETDGDES